MALEILYGLGAVALAIAVVVGLRMNRRRDARNDAVTAAAVRAEYRDPAGYDPKPFEDELK